jgi:hypothetical protein
VPAVEGCRCRNGGAERLTITVPGVWPATGVVGKTREEKKLLASTSVVFLGSLIMLLWLFILKNLIVAMMKSTGPASSFAGH